MCFVRKGLDRVFDQRELKWLDDIMPEAHKRAKEDEIIQQEEVGVNNFYKNVQRWHFHGSTWEKNMMAHIISFTLLYIYFIILLLRILGRFLPVE